MADLYQTVTVHLVEGRLRIFVDPWGEMTLRWQDGEWVFEDEEAAPSGVSAPGIMAVNGKLDPSDKATLASMTPEDLALALFLWRRDYDAP